MVGSGIRKKPIPDPGSGGQKGTGSRIPDPDPQHWVSYASEHIINWKINLPPRGGGYQPMSFRGKNMKSGKEKGGNVKGKEERGKKTRKGEVKGEMKCKIL